MLVDGLILLAALTASAPGPTVELSVCDAAARAGELAKWSYSTRDVACAWSEKWTFVGAANPREAFEKELLGRGFMIVTSREISVIAKPDPKLVAALADAVGKCPAAAASSEPLALHVEIDGDGEHAAATLRPAGEGTPHGDCVVKASESLSLPASFGRSTTYLLPLRKPLAASVVAPAVADRRGGTRDLMRGKERALDECFRKHGVRGKAAVKLVVGPQGDVVGTSVVGPAVRDRAFEACVVAKAAQWKFPKPEGGSTMIVNHSFVFEDPPAR